MRAILSSLFIFLVLAPGLAPAAAPTTAVKVVVPDYEVEKAGDQDIVTIPGGRILASEEGRPVVPYWVETVPVPPGFRVQAVSLVGKSESETGTGLRLPLVQPDEGDAVAPQPGLFPAVDFSWRAKYGERPSLTLAVYPLRYDPKTTETRFCREFEFAVRYAGTKVSITDVRTDTSVFEPGDKVGVWVLMENRGGPQEILVAGSVRRPLQDKPVAELKPVPATLGAADSVRLEWSSAGTGDREFEAIVLDKQGNELDRGRTLFRLGAPRGEVLSFTAEPGQFKVGDNIGLTLEFRNTGSADVAGECVFRVMESGKVLGELTEPMSALKPGATRTFRKTWSTENAARGTVYHAVGFVRFAGTASEARSAAFSTNLMPNAGFTFMPDTAAVGEEVMFDASTSADEDGSIVEYRWDFDDGGEAKDSVATHTFWQPGEYEVRLVVKDNEGGTGTAARALTVSE